MKERTVKNPSLVERLKSIFKKNDYTSAPPIYDMKHLNDEESAFAEKVKKIYNEEFEKQLKGFGSKSSLSNYSDDDPIKSIRNSNSEYVTGALLKILNDEKATENLFEFGDEAFTNMLTNQMQAYADEHGKTPGELSEEEILECSNAVADKMLASTVQLQQLSQSIPELMDIVRENPSAEDFNAGSFENHPKIDFERKQYGTRLKNGSVLSFDELAESALVGLGPDEYASELSDFDIMNIAKGFIDTLDETD
ncbi:MAG: hypothetical protein KBT46_01480 [Ruminococcus sp.]|nr:hypothetical protein [Candidatus Copronaster equi]